MHVGVSISYLLKLVIFFMSELPSFYGGFLFSFFTLGVEGVWKRSRSLCLMCVNTLGEVVLYCGNISNICSLSLR